MACKELTAIELPTNTSAVRVCTFRDAMAAFVRLTESTVIELTKTELSAAFSEYNVSAYIVLADKELTPASSTFSV